MTAATDRPVRGPLEPDPSSPSWSYWDGARRGQLLIQRCDACGLYVHYPRPVCRCCHGRALTPTPVSGRGEVHAFTVMEQAFHPFWATRVPYVVALVELEEQAGLRVLSNVVGCDVDDVHSGMAVEVDFEALTDTLTVPVFRPRTDP